jgi:hypothetical protein
MSDEIPSAHIEETRARARAGGRPETVRRAGGPRADERDDS